MTAAPDWLSEEARQVWDRTVVPPGTNLETLAIYCSAVADHNAAQRLLNRSGPLVRDAHGSVVPSPLTRVKTNNANLARQLSRTLGIGLDPTVTEPPKRRYRNTKATERTVTSLRELGHLEPVDEANVALTRALAEALDTIDPETNPGSWANLARVHLDALRLLRGNSADDNDTGVSDWLAGLHTTVGDAPES